MIKRILKNIVDKLGYRVNSNKYIPKPLQNKDNILALDFDHVLSKYLINKNKESDVFFIQIGTFDGIECDPLRKYLLKYNWTGLMMEPQPGPFKRLENEYATRKGLVLLNAAIGKECVKSMLYTIESNHVPEWAKGMASFNREVILKHTSLFPHIEEYIKEVEVDTLSFEYLFNEFAIKHIDVLQIDTEGYDANIIQMFPFNKVMPAIIHFESKHIAKAELKKTLDILLAKGYKIARDGEEDMTAVLHD